MVVWNSHVRFSFHLENIRFNARFMSLFLLILHGANLKGIFLTSKFFRANLVKDYKSLPSSLKIENSLPLYKQEIVYRNSRYFEKQKAPIKYQGSGLKTG
jgi:hypothetical protein